MFFSLIAALDVHRLMEFLAYLGYISSSDENQLSAIVGKFMVPSLSYISFPFSKSLSNY